jgi:hypothetical protein
MGNFVTKLFRSKKMASENIVRGEKREVESDISIPSKKLKIVESEYTGGRYEKDYPTNKKMNENEMTTPKNTEELPQPPCLKKPRMSTQAAGESMETDSAEDVPDANVDRFMTGRRSLAGQFNEAFRNEQIELSSYSSPFSTLRNPTAAPRRHPPVPRRMIPGSSNMFSQQRRSPKHVEYVSYYDRMDTFERWPLQMVQTPHDMASAGFIYRGFGDSVECFHCGEALRDWRVSDDAMTEHKRHSPNCHYMNLVWVTGGHI